MEILCIGLNHETAPISVREKFALTQESLPTALQWLKARPGIQEALILSTCNRVEFYLVSEKGCFQGTREIHDLFEEDSGLAIKDWDQVMYRHRHQEAIAHLFRVTAGMDSMVIGEPQIAGQVKDAYREAVLQETMGTVLNRLLHKSFSVSKRVRTETELAARAVSVSCVAVELAKKIFEDLRERTVMLVGAGEMAELAARHLTSHGVAKILVASRTPEHARRVALAFQGEAIPLDSVPQCLEGTDILICSTAAPNYILRAEQISEAMGSRKQRPVFIVDISVPRNIDPRADLQENVYLYDMDDLQKVVQANREERRRELKKAESIVQEEVREFLSWLRSLDLVPTISALSEKAEQIRRKEVKKAFSVMTSAVSDKQKQVVEAMSRAIVKKLLHHPISELKSAERQQEGAGLLEVFQQLFALGPHAGH